jgi:hypothetical protein
MPMPRARKSSPESPQVNFVIGGTQKGGTSALDLFLRQHPQICMPETRKELHFFDREENFAKKPPLKKYHANFHPQRQHRVLGEATPIYMYWNAAPTRIWSYNPEMKWIIILRQPAERAFSAWSMENHRRAEDLSFEEAIEQEAARSRRSLPLQERVFSYVDRGFYASQIRRLFNIFGEEQCLVLLNEDLRDNHWPTLQRVFEFLELDDSPVVAPAAVFQQEYDEEMDPQLFARLTARFHFDIKELERLLKRDLSAWYSNT